MEVLSEWFCISHFFSLPIKPFFSKQGKGGVKGRLRWAILMVFRFDFNQFVLVLDLFVVDFEWILDQTHGFKLARRGLDN